MIIFKKCAVPLQMVKLTKRMCKVLKKSYEGCGSCGLYYKTFLGIHLFNLLARLPIFKHLKIIQKWPCLQERVAKLTPNNSV
jgi:hypothetical protein